MSATPRTVPVTVPSPSHPRHDPRVNAHPVGTVSLFLVATGILGLTSLCYLWQAGQATAAAMRIQSLTYQLQSAQNQTQQLRSQIAQLTSPAMVMQAASTRYGMRMPLDPSVVRQIGIPGPVVLRVVTVPVPAQRSGVRVGWAATDSTVTSWWQDAWVALYKLLH